MSKFSDSVPGRLDALPDVLFVEDLAEVFRCSPSTIRRRVRAGVLPIPMLSGVDKRWRFSRAVVAAYLARGGIRTHR